MSLFDLTGKVAVITGSSRGIGKAIATEFVAHGAQVVISSRKAEACDKTAAEINAKFGKDKALAIPASISSKEALQALVDRTRAAFGHIDIVVCNAASNPYYGPSAGMSDELFRKTLDNNIVSNHWLIHMVLPEMVKRRQGSVILISSVGAFRAVENIYAYNITKAADVHMARGLAQEYGKHGIRFNCIAPGFIRTDFSRALWENPEAEAALNKTIPLGRLGEPQDIASAAVFFASDASSYVSGQTLIIDGASTV